MAMTKRDAYRLGVESGLEAALEGDFTPEELSDEDAFYAACLEICENKRQYAGHPFEEIAEVEVERRDGLYEAFEEGEERGIKEAWKKQQQED